MSFFKKLFGKGVHDSPSSNDAPSPIGGSSGFASNFLLQLSKPKEIIPCQSYEWDGEYGHPGIRNTVKYVFSNPRNKKNRSMVNDDKLWMKWSDFKVTSLLHEEDFVFCGEWKENEDLEFVLKVHHYKMVQHQMSNVIQQMEAEVKKTQLFKCPNILKVHQCFLVENYVGYLVEKCEVGDLEHFLSRNSEIGFPLKLDIMIEVATILSFLYSQSPKILFRDLRPEKFLVDDKLQVKAVNPRIHRILSRASERKRRVTDAQYKAPEHATCEYTEKNEVYSFSIIMWQVLFSKIRAYDERFYGCYQDWRITRAVRNDRKFRPRLNGWKSVPKRFQRLFTTLFQRCWTNIADVRPSMGEILTTLKSFKGKKKKGKYFLKELDLVPIPAADIEFENDGKGVFLKQMGTDDDLAVHMMLEEPRMKALTMLICDWKDIVPKQIHKICKIHSRMNQWVQISKDFAVEKLAEDSMLAVVFKKDVLEKQEEKKRKIYLKERSQALLHRSQQSFHFRNHSSCTITVVEMCSDPTYYSDEEEDL